MRRYLKRLAYGHLYRARLRWWEVVLAHFWLLRCRFVLWQRGEPFSRRFL